MSRELARDARTVVVKVGSSILTRDGAIEASVFDQLSDQIAQLCDAGRHVVLVSSGAIAVGSHALGWSHPGGACAGKTACCWGWP